MFRNILLSTILVVLGLWIAGYDVVSIKDSIWSKANRQASSLSGRAQMESGDWGSRG